METALHKSLDDWSDMARRLSINALKYPAHIRTQVSDDCMRSLNASNRHFYVKLSLLLRIGYYGFEPSSRLKR